MKKVDIREEIFVKLGLPELFAQALSKKLDKPYEETLKYVSVLFEKKIDDVEKTIGTISHQNDISIDNPKDFDEWIKNAPVIKG